MKIKKNRDRDLFSIRPYLRTLKEVNLMSQAKVSHNIKLQLTESIYDDFLAFCQKYQCTEAEAVEIAIKFLLDKIHTHYQKKTLDSVDSKGLDAGEKPASEDEKRLNELLVLLNDQLEAMDQLLVLKKKP
jgi:hypothetical protein